VIWSFFVPASPRPASTRWPGSSSGFVAASALLGLLFAPSNAGKSFDQIQRERGGDADGHGDDEPRFTRERAGAGVPA
jgi:hypothetical protein